MNGPPLGLLPPMRIYPSWLCRRLVPQELSSLMMPRRIAAKATHRYKSGETVISPSPAVPPGPYVIVRLLR